MNGFIVVVIVGVVLIFVIIVAVVVVVIIVAAAAVVSSSLSSTTSSSPSLQLFSSPSPIPSSLSSYHMAGHPLYLPPLCSHSLYGDYCATLWVG